MDPEQKKRFREAVDRKSEAAEAASHHPGQTHGSKAPSRAGPARPANTA